MNIIKNPFNSWWKNCEKFSEEIIYRLKIWDELHNGIDEFYEVIISVKYCSPSVKKGDRKKLKNLRHIKLQRHISLWTTKWFWKQKPCFPLYLDTAFDKLFLYFTFSFKKLIIWFTFYTYIRFYLLEASHLIFYLRISLSCSSDHPVFSRP